MKTDRLKIILALAALFAALAATGASAQKKSKQPEATTGGISGRVKVGAGASPSGVSVVVREGDREVAHAETNAKGEFEVQNLAPGSYGLTLRKAGLQVGRMDGVEVRAGKTNNVKGNLYLPLDEGAIAHLRGSVFSADGRSLGGARVELARLEADGSAKKVDERVTNGLGQFSFRLPPARGRYRVTAKADGMQAASEVVEVDGAAIFRVALSLSRAQK